MSYGLINKSKIKLKQQGHLMRIRLLLLSRRWFYGCGRYFLVTRVEIFLRLLQLLLIMLRLLLMKMCGIGVGSYIEHI